MLTVIAIIRLFIQYLLHPLPFILTIVVPIMLFLINRKYVWFSIPLAVLVQLMVRWDEFCYYESRGLWILFTLLQIAVMVIVIWILSAAASKRRT